MAKLRLVAGFIIAFVIGAVCRYSGVPVPAPPALVGALTVLSMTSGYLLGGRLFKQKAENEENCGGPVG